MALVMRISAAWYRWIETPFLPRYIIESTAAAEWAPGSAVWLYSVS